jgi:hypothetical protein
MAEFLFKLSALDLDAHRIARRTLRAASRGDGPRAVLAITQGDDEASLVITLPGAAPAPEHRAAIKPAPGEAMALEIMRRACAEAAADAHITGSMSIPQDYDTFRTGFLAGVAWQEKAAGEKAPAVQYLSVDGVPICARTAAAMRIKAARAAEKPAPAKLAGKRADFVVVDEWHDAPAGSGGGAVLVVVIGVALTLGALIGAALS